MRFSAAIWLSSFAVLASPAQASQPAFDLICHGNKTGQQLHFRFDLPQRKWCFGECQSVWGIDRMGDAMIELVTYSSDGNNDWTFRINRFTGTFDAIRRGYGSEPKDSGNCKPQVFSGFPSKKF